MQPMRYCVAASWVSLWVISSRSFSNASRSSGLISPADFAFLPTFESSWGELFLDSDMTDHPAPPCGRATQCDAGAPLRAPRVEFTPPQAPKRSRTATCAQAMSAVIGIGVCGQFARTARRTSGEQEVADTASLSARWTVTALATALAYCTYCDGCTSRRPARVQGEEEVTRLTSQMQVRPTLSSWMLALAASASTHPRPKRPERRGYKSEWAGVGALPRCSDAPRA